MNSINSNKRGFVFAIHRHMCVFWQALEDRSNYMIVIMSKDVMMERLDETMRLYVRNKTYLRRGDRWFWERLQRALPQNPMCTLPGGQRGEDWCGVHALAHAQHEEQQRREEVEIDLGDHRCQYHKQAEVDDMDVEGACAWWGYWRSVTSMSTQQTTECPQVIIKRVNGWNYDSRKMEVVEYKPPQHYGNMWKVIYLSPRLTWCPIPVYYSHI